jgi:hypothetical protein
VAPSISLNITALDSSETGSCKGEQIIRYFRRGKTGQQDGAGRLGLLYRSRCKTTEVGREDILDTVINLEGRETADEKTDDVSAGEVGDDVNVVLAVPLD